jgi:ParB-like chromosome segregation protein Spo0J
MGVKAKRGAREIKFRKVSDLAPYAKNPRTHSESQVRLIADSIQRFGFTNPILLNGQNNILAGHGRLLAAAKLKLNEVPCIDLDGLSPAEQRAYIIADNQLAIAAGWDLSLLAEELQAIALDGIDVTSLGFSEAELATLESIGAKLDSQDEWSGMPEFSQSGDRAFRRLVVHFPDQESVDKFSELFGMELTERTRFAWYPPQQEREHSKSHYETETTDESE